LSTTAPEVTRPGGRVKPSRAVSRLLLPLPDSRTDQLEPAVEALRAVDGKILGVVLTMVPTKGPDAYQGYGHGYGSYRSDERKPQMSNANAVLALEVPPPPARTHERLSGDSAPADRY
jgi:hypothetical protein